MTQEKDTWDSSITDEAPTARDEVKALYDDFASTYTRAVESWGYSAPDVVAEYLATSLRTAATHSAADANAEQTLSTDPHADRPLNVNSPVLDAGCGTGLTGAALAKRGFTHVTGTDLSTDSLELAKETGHYQALHELDLTRTLPFESCEFGGIICAGVFSYIPDAIPVLREFVRLLQPGGTLVFTQREDHFLQRDCARQFDQLHAEGDLERIEESTPQPYLPGNPSFTDEISVLYFVWRKVRQRSD